MELRVLSYFLAIAREENFSKAAEQLHITQPTLSRQIAQLEDELGITLFVRSNHGLRLTEDGMVLKRRAQELLELANKTKNDFLCKGENLEGTISIGSGEFLSTRVLADCISQFRKKYPLVHYEIFSGSGEMVSEKLDRGLFDIGLMSEPVDPHKYDYVTMPVKEQWGALVQKNSPLAEKQTLSPKDLVGIPLISAQSNIAGSNIGKWFGKYLPDINIIAKGDLLYNEALLAQSNIGAVIGIKLDCTYDGLRFIPFSPALEHKTVLAWKKDQGFSSVVSAFIDFFKQYLESIADNLI